MSQTILLCDITHGTQMRTALLTPSGAPGDIREYFVNSADAFDAAILDFLDFHDSGPVSAAAISAPGWERDGWQSMPYHDYGLERERLRGLLNVQRLHIVNTGVARALAIPRLDDVDCKRLWPGDPEPDRVKGVVGAGAGLGMAALVPDDFGGWMASPGAGGHSDLAATDALEFALLNILTRKYGHVSRERVLSWGGLAEIWSGLGEVEGRETDPKTAEEIFELAASGDPHALETLRLCIGWLAAAASDTALFLGARGGMYLTGELVRRLQSYIDPAAFHKRYCHKGRLADYLHGIPVFLVDAPHIELTGLSTLFD